MNSFLSNVIKGIDNTNILADGGNSSEFTGTIDTGSYIMNAVLSGSLYGGVPNNKITAFAGESATGKTFFVLGVIKQFLEDNKTGGVIYFDTFPDHSGLNPIEESNTNILIVNRLKKIAHDLYQNTELNRAIERQDATISQRIISQELYGNKN